jgi:HSP20 family protein
MIKAKTNQPAKTRKAKKNEQLTGEVDLEASLPAPIDLVRRFRNEIDRLFEDSGLGKLTRSLPDAGSLGLGMWTPEVEVFERAGEMVVRADLPGLTSDDIKIDLTNSSITIYGERKQEHEEGNGGYYRSERSYGRFYRKVPLPEGTEVDTAKAQFRDGVLEVSFAASEQKERKARRVEISGQSTPARAKVAVR